MLTCRVSHQCSDTMYVWTPCIFERSYAKAINPIGLKTAPSYRAGHCCKPTVKMDIIPSVREAEMQASEIINDRSFERNVGHAFVFSAYPIKIFAKCFDLLV